MRNVACGVMLNNERHVLMGLRTDNDSTRSSTMGVWEFPGGKQEEGETLEECLHREWREELNLEISVGERIHVTEFDGFMCHFFIGTVYDMENLRTNVHERVELFSVADALGLHLFPGDDMVLNLIPK